MNSRFIRLFFILLLGYPALAAPEPESSPPKLTFGVVPQQAVTELAQAWGPLLGYLSRKTGYSIQFRTAPDISTFERRVEAGEFDFAYINPLHYATYRVNAYQAIAKEKDTRVTGIVVVSKASAIRSLNDLNGLTMAFPSPTAFAATVLPQLYMKQLGVSVTPKYVSSHESVYRAVAQGLYPVGGGVVKTYEQVDPAVRDQLRILWKSASYTPHPIAAHPQVSRKAVQRLVAALLAMDSDPAGVAILKAAGLKGFDAAQDSDYDDIRALSVSITQPGTVELRK